MQSILIISTSPQLTPWKPLACLPPNFVCSFKILTINNTPELDLC